MITIFIILYFSLASRLVGMERFSFLGKGLSVLGLLLVIHDVTSPSYLESFLIGFTGMIGISVGHGAFYRLGYEPRRAGDNWPAWLPRQLGLPRDSWSFNALALCITGLAFTATVSAILLFHGHKQASLLLLAGGASKTLAYDIGWRLWTSARSRPFLQKLGLKHGTELGEIMRGAFLGLFVSIIV